MEAENKLVINREKSIFNGMCLDFSKIYKHLSKTPLLFTFIHNRRPYLFEFSKGNESTFFEFNLAAESHTWTNVENPAVFQSIKTFFENIIECEDCKNVISEKNTYDNLCNLCFVKKVFTPPKNSDICAICHEVMIRCPNNGGITFLSCCKNYFHTACLSKIDNRKCPLCKEVFSLCDCGEVCHSDEDDEELIE